MNISASISVKFSMKQWVPSGATTLNLCTNAVVPTCLQHPCIWVSRHFLSIKLCHWQSNKLVHKSLADSIAQLVFFTTKHCQRKAFLRKHLCFSKLDFDLRVSIFINILVMHFLAVLEICLPNVKGSATYNQTSTLNICIREACKFFVCGPIYVSINKKYWVFIFWLHITVTRPNSALTTLTTTLLDPTLHCSTSARHKGS